MAEPDASDGRRQRVERVAGSRRARLTPAPGSDPAPEVPLKKERPTTLKGHQGPNDERMLGDVPPHY